MNRISAAFLMTGALYLASTLSAVASCESEKAAVQGDAEKLDENVKISVDAITKYKDSWDTAVLGPKPPTPRAALLKYADWTERGQNSSILRPAAARYMACSIRAYANAMPDSKTASNNPAAANSSNAQQERASASGRGMSGAAGSLLSNQQAQRDTRQRGPAPPPVSGCVDLDPTAKLYGGFVNKCAYDVYVSYCAFHPKKGAWNELFDCEKDKGGLDHIAAMGVQAAHTNGTQMHWFACKAPSLPADVYFHGKLYGRCS